MTTEHQPGAPDHALPRLVAAGIGAALQAVDALTELGAETVQATITRTRALEREVDRRYHQAARRGDEAVGHALGVLAHRLDRAADSAAAWTDREVVRRIAESMRPYLVEDLVPEVIDGVLPKIRADVMPAVLADLAHDDQVQDMVAAQSMGMVSRGVEEVRHASADADDRVEVGLRKLFGRHGSDGSHAPQGSPSSQEAQGLQDSPGLQDSQGPQGPQG